MSDKVKTKTGKKRKRTQKGILGVRKSRTLFSFGSRVNWSDSDSSDSDYVPSDEDLKLERPKSQRRVEKKQRLSKSEDQKKEIKIFEESGKSKSSTTFDCLPIDVLTHIFSFVVLSEGVLPFLEKIKKLNESAREAALHPALWRQIDMSSGKITDHLTPSIQKRWVDTISKANKNLTELVSFSGWKKLNDTLLLKALEECPRLKELLLQGCKTLTSEVLVEICTKYPHLTHLNLGLCQPDMLSSANFDTAVSRVRNSLTHLNISLNFIQRPRLLFETLYNHAPKLQCLDISNCRSQQSIPIDIQKFQTSCPDITSLRLGNSPITWKREYDIEAAPGFPKLKELNMARLATGAGAAHLSYDLTLGNFNPPVLTRLLHSSAELTALDLRGVQSLSYEEISSLPATGLRWLTLGWSTGKSANSSDGCHLARACEKWKRTLVELDISKLKLSSEDLGSLITHLTNDVEASQLKGLDLRETRITKPQLCLLLRRTPKLEYLDVSSCRNLDRGMKSNFSGSRIEELRRHLKC